jgi:hypothetical protein
VADREAPPRRAWLLVIVVVLAVWLAAGALRAETVARDYFVTAHGSGATVAGVQVEGSGPAVPPFWSVTLSGDVIETGKTTPSYRSAMILWVEPITGWVIVTGAG